MCLFVSVLTFIEGGQQEIGAQVLFAVREVKPSQIIVVCIWPPNAIQKSQIAASLRPVQGCSTPWKRD